MSFKVDVSLPTQDGEIDTETLEEKVEWNDRGTDDEWCILNLESKRAEDGGLDTSYGEWWIRLSDGDIWGGFAWTLTPTDDNKVSAKRIYEFLGLPEFDGGISLGPDQFSEVVEKTVNEDGRISVGTKYAGKQVKAVVIEESEEDEDDV